MRRNSNKTCAKVQSVLLFTDGQANEGIVDKDQLLESVGISTSGSYRDLLPTPIGDKQPFFEPSSSSKQNLLSVIQAATLTESLQLLSELPESPPPTPGKTPDSTVSTLTA